jgi:hypothetical protein
MTGDDLLRLFHGFRDSAFRLESLPAYDIEADAEALNAWREGKPPPASQLDRDWCHLVSGAADAGKTITRVRVVRHPLSEYVRFELDWGYPQNIDAGEDIRILELGPADELPGLPDPGRGYDFWCFDGTTVVRLEYDEAGRFIRPVDVSDHAAQFIACQDWAMARAVAFRHWTFIRDAEQASH